MIDSYVSQIFKFSGAGNDFVVLDGRWGGMEPFREPVRIGQLCKQYHTDGLMILTSPGRGQTAESLQEKIADQVGNDGGAGNVGPAMADGDQPSQYDFVMEFYNPDGSGGMMCGNGGRCIVAFADYLGILPADGRTYRFLAPDGDHIAEILSKEHSAHWTVRLKMIDVQGITPMKDGYFLNTGTRHLVRFVPEVDGIDMEMEAKPLRWDAAFQPEGTNVNFVAVRADGLHVRTFEKGVEGETLACGTGLTASALAAFKAGIPSAGQIPGQAGNDGTAQAGNDGECHGRHQSAISYRLQCRRGDWLQVCFRPGPDDRFTEVYLTGPAELVAVNPL